MTKKSTSRIIATMLAIILTLGIVTLFTTASSFAATSYVTMSTTGSNYTGTIPVYKTATGSTQWTSNSLNGVISKNVYVTYVGTSGDYYKVNWGTSYGYIKKSQATTVSLLPTGATKLTSSKKETHGVYSNYLASGTYVIYADSSAGKIKWGTYCSNPADIGNEDKWVTPAYAYLKAL